MPPNRPTGAAILGYGVFAAGTVLGALVAWLAWKPDSDDNPAIVLLLVWVVVGIAHIFVRAFWRACALAALGSAVGYAVLALVTSPNALANEMFGAGIIEVGLFGFVASMVMGIPVVIYRRGRK